VVVDSHYELKHANSINDRIILTLIQSIDGIEAEAIDVDEEGFEYFVSFPLFFEGKAYKLVWILHPNENFIGVINCYRRKYGNK